MSGTQLPGTARTTRRAGLVFAAITVLSLTAVACGESDSGGDSGGKKQQQGNSAAEGDRAAALVKYSQCMRDNGVAEFPDPVDGRLRLQVQRGGPLDPENATYKSALAACKDKEPPGLAGSGQDAGREKALLKFVTCMRENGVKEFPDPVGGRIQLNRGPGLDPESAPFKKAEEACRQHMPGGAAPGGS